MVKLVIGESKKGNRYQAIVYVKENGKRVFLTFNFITVLTVCGKSVDELNNLPYGEYDI